jgi:hypothetical protein
MKHKTTKSLYSYWDVIRKNKPAPDRQDIDPMNIRASLADTFILEVENVDTFTFRLAGTRLCSCFCRELKGRNFLDLWQGEHTEAIQTLLMAVHEEGAAAVIGIKATNHRMQSLQFELLFLPLTYKSSNFTRIMGSLAPMDTPYWLGVHPLIKCEVTTLRLIWPDEKPHFLKSAAHVTPEVFPTPAIRRGHLLVYEGGRIDNH